MKNKRLFLYLTFLLMMSVCKGQEFSLPVFKSETLVPRIFKSADYKYFELSGKVKTTEWIVEEYTITGNTDRWYFTDGYIDKINLQFNNRGTIISGNYVRHSKKVYSKPKNKKIESIIYEKNSVVLEQSNNPNDISVNHLNYTKYINNNTGNLIEKDAFFRYYYNKQGDVTDVITIQPLGQPHNRHFHYEYQYDKNGNWITRVITDEPYNVDYPTKKTTVQKITRTIQYN